MKRVDHEQRRLEVAVAAARIIAYQGLDALTTRELARTLGCSIGVLSHYFTNKDEIVIAAMNWADCSIQQRFMQLLKESPMDVDQYAPFILDALPLNEQSDLEWRVRLNLAAYSLSHPALMQSQNEARQLRKKELLKLMRDLQASGRVLNNVEPELIVQNAIDFVTGTAFNLLNLPLEERAEKVEFIAQYLLTLQQ